MRYWLTLEKQLSLCNQWYQITEKVPIQLFIIVDWLAKLHFLTNTLRLSLHKGRPVATWNVYTLLLGFFIVLLFSFFATTKSKEIDYGFILILVNIRKIIWPVGTRITVQLEAPDREEAAEEVQLRAYRKRKRLIYDCSCIPWKRNASVRFAKAFSVTRYSLRSVAIVYVLHVFPN